MPISMFITLNKLVVVVINGFNKRRLYMNYNGVIKIGDAYLLPLVSELYGLEGYEINPVAAHDGGRNVVYTCEKEGASSKVIRISQEDFW